MKKLSVNSLALGNLKARKKQYARMIISVILAMIFSSGTLLFISSIAAGSDDLKRQHFGNEDLIFLGVSDEAFSDCADSLGITDHAAGENIGYLFTGDESAGTSVARLTDEANDMYYTRITEGRYPEKKDEIAIERDALARMKLKVSVGDTIKLKMKVQSGNGYLDGVIEKSYVLSGIVSNRRSYIFGHNEGCKYLPAAFISGEEAIEPGGKEQEIIFARVDEKIFTYEKYLDISARYAQGDQADGTIEYVYRDYAPSPFSNGRSAVVISVILLLVSCVGIVNAFNANLLERKKQIGFLRALGATRRQIVKIYGREAFIIALFCTPVSVAVSFFGTRLVVSLIDDDLLLTTNIPVLIGCAAASVSCVMLAALIPLFKASRISPMQAIRNTDMTRKMRRGRIKSKTHFSVPSLLAKRNMTFGKVRYAAVSIMLIFSILLSGMLVSPLSGLTERYYGEGDYSVWNTTSVDVSGVNTGAGAHSFGFTGNDISEILALPYVERIEGFEKRELFLLTDKSDEYIQILKSGYCQFFDETGADIDDITGENYAEFIKANTQADGYDEVLAKNLGGRGTVITSAISSIEKSDLKMLEPYVMAGSIDPEKINSGEEIILALPEEIALVVASLEFDSTINLISFDTVSVDDEGNINRIYLEDTRYKILKKGRSEFAPGDTVDLSMIYDYRSDPEEAAVQNSFDDCKRYDKTVRIGAIVSPDCPYANSGLFHTISFITSHEGFHSFGVDDRYYTMEIYLDRKCTDEIDEEMQQRLNFIISDMDASLYSKYAQKRNAEQDCRITLISLILVLILIFVICVSLVNNALTARIRESKKEIGTLRAVGASVSELTKSYVLQLLAMFSIGFIGGFTLYGLLFAGVRISEKVKKAPSGLTFSPWIPVVICAVMFIICSVNLYIEIKKHTKASIVDNIREL